MINNTFDSSFLTPQPMMINKNKFNQFIISESVKKLNNIQKQDSFTYSTVNSNKSPDYPKSPIKKPVDVSIFYIADIHGKMTNMERIASVAKRFDAMNSDKDNIKLKLASGDILLGSNPMTNKVASNFLDWAGITVNALGNHELDATPEALAESIKDSKYSLLAANVTVKSGSPLEGKIKKSIIEEHNGEKFGIIGTAPSDVLERVGTRESLEDIKVDVIRDLTDAWEKFVIARNNLNYYNKELLSNSRELLEESKESLEKKDIDITSFLVSKKLYLEVMLGYEAALAEYYSCFAELLKEMNAESLDVIKYDKV